MALSLYSVPVSVPSLAGPRVSLDENGYNQPLSERRAQMVSPPVALTPSAEESKILLHQIPKTAGTTLKAEQ